MPRHDVQQPSPSRSDRASLPPEVAERLGPFYVYVLVDPRDSRIFYVGKGTGQRLLSHGRDADLISHGPNRSNKVGRIREIRAGGSEPRLDVVRHGLTEPEAFLVEAALIDCLDLLTNAVSGHGSDQGRAPLVEHIVRYGADPVAADAPPAVLIRLSRWKEQHEEIEPGVWRTGNGYRPSDVPTLVADSTRAWWRISPDSLERRGIRHAVAVHEGTTRGVMEIGEWIQREDGRRAFAAAPLEDGLVFEAWVGRFGKRVDFVSAAQNPITYWPSNRA